MQPPEAVEAADRPPLVVWCADAEAAAPVLRALEHRFDIALRATLPAAAEDTGMLLLYASPAGVLREAMATAGDPDAALAGWRRQMQRILDLNRRDRRRIRLADQSAALRHPDRFCACLDLPDSAVWPAAAHDSDDILLLLARQMLQGESAGSTVMRELEAASLVLAGADGPGGAENGAAARAYRSLIRTTEGLERQNRAMQTEIDALGEAKEALTREIEGSRDAARQAQAAAESRAALQVDLLQAQNRAMQEEMETLTQRRQQLEQRLDQLNQGLESYQAQITELQNRQAGLARKMAGKERGLQAAGERVQELETLVTQLRDETDRTRRARSETQHRLEQVLRSRSYRLTAPLRRMRALISGRKQP